MIEELTTYISEIKEQFGLDEFVDGPAQGLHIMLEMQDGKVQLFNHEIYKSKKGEKNNYSDFLREECLPKEIHIDYIGTRKAIIGKEGRKIHSASPFALKIRKKSFDKNWAKWFPKKGISNEEKNNITNHLNDIEEKVNHLNKLNGEEKKEYHIKIIQEKNKRIAKYFGNLIQRYFEKANKVCSPGYENEKDFEKVLKFQKYCIETLPALIGELAGKIIQLNQNDDIIVLLRDLPVELYREANSNYLKDYVFNVDYYNWPKKINNEVYGLSDFFNSDKPKKPYIKHLTTPFYVNFRLSQGQALLLNTFNRYCDEDAFITNPLPIFIDQVELNNEVVNVVKTEGKQVNFHKIIRILFERKKGDLGNYYLFYFWGGDVKDLDFVSSFSFSLDVRLRQIIPKAQPDNDILIKDIFQFENQILQPVFNNQLQNNYFIDISDRASKIKNPDHPLKSSTLQGLLHKYRIAFYDYIYKSRRQAVTNTMFQDIMQQSIIDDIHRDEIKSEKNNKRYHSKTNDIYRKLNIWYSLWDFFGKENKKNDLTMASKIEQHQERLRVIRDHKSDEHLQTDEEFAFTVGQIVYFLLDQSKSENKTHALLEPFLQKTNAKELKKAIVKTFNAYKHEIDFRKGRFEKLCSEVMDYDLDGNLKELMPFILAGYFSNSLIYEKSES